MVESHPTRPLDLTSLPRRVSPALKTPAGGNRSLPHWPMRRVQSCYFSLTDRSASRWPWRANVAKITPVLRPGPPRSRQKVGPCPRDVPPDLAPRFGFPREAEQATEGARRASSGEIPQALATSRRRTTPRAAASRTAWAVA